MFFPASRRDHPALRDIDRKEEAHLPCVLVLQTPGKTGTLLPPITAPPPLVPAVPVESCALSRGSHRAPYHRTTDRIASPPNPPLRSQGSRPTSALTGPSLSTYTNPQPNHSEGQSAAPTVYTVHPDGPDGPDHTTTLPRRGVVYDLRSGPAAPGLRCPAATALCMLPA